MAVLAKIRQRSALLIATIALALFAFIIQDLIGKTGFGSDTKDVGEVNGVQISFDDFRIKVNNVEKSGQGITPIQAANQVWEQEVSLALVTAEFEKLGIRIGERHLMEVLKGDPNIGNNPLFKNESGVFDEAKFKAYFESNPSQVSALAEREKTAELNAKFQIYTNLVQSALFTTTSEAKWVHEIENSSVDFSYVAGKYSSIKDSQVPVSDDEVKDYMKKNDKKYKFDVTRSIEYVLVADKASVADEDDAKKKIKELLSGRVVYNQDKAKNDTLKGFREAKDVVAFVNENSDIPYDSTYIVRDNLPKEDATALFQLSEGSVYGPYKVGSYYCLSKVLARKSAANARASHILISYVGTQVPIQKEQRTKEQAKAKAEAILAAVQQNPQNFAIQAVMNSDDTSGQRGGDLGYFGRNQMVKPFNDFVFNNSKGKIGLVETPFGFHIIKIEDKQDGLRLATVAQKIVPSEITSDELFRQATAFEMEAATQPFDALAKKMKLSVSPVVTSKSMEESFGALGNQRAIIRWAFDEETAVGSVKRFELANIGHVIARLKSIDDTGLMPLDKARVFIEPILRNEKKAALLREKMKGTSLDSMAKLVGSKVEKVSNVKMTNPVLDGGFSSEPKVVGVAFSLKKNQFSAPIEGNTGVYVVKSELQNKALKLTNYSAYVSRLKQASANDLGRTLPALKANAKIVDNRIQFNY